MQYIYPDGQILCAQAQEIAKHLPVDASSSWLEKWKARHNIKRMTISGGVRQQILEKNTYQRLWKGMNMKMSGIWMRVDAFGRPCLVKGLPERKSISWREDK